MEQEDRSAHKRKGPSTRLEMFLNWAIIIVCLLLIAAALRSHACAAARGESAPMLASAPARSLSAGAHPISISQIPRRLEMGRRMRQISASLPGATLPIGGDPQKADPLANVSAQEIRTVFSRTLVRTVFCPLFYGWAATNCSAALWHCSRQFSFALVADGC